MDIRYSLPQDDIKGLWDIAFPGDTPGVYFNHEFPHAKVLVYEDGGKIAAMLHCVEYELCLWDERINCAYLLGIATHPAHRSRGLASDLVEQALFELHLRKIPLAFLMPAKPSLMGFYSRFGFRGLCSRMKLEGMPRRGVKASRSELDTVSLAYERMTAGISHMLRPRQVWDRICDDYDIELLPDGGYAVFDQDCWMEGTDGIFAANHPTAACVKIIEYTHMAGLAQKHGRPVPEAVTDNYCPWNRSPGTGGTGVSAEEFWFSSEMPYVNLMYNGKDVAKW